MKILWQGRSTNVFLAHEVEELIQAEREACAGICEENAKLSNDYQAYAHILDARAIRQRGKTIYKQEAGDE